MAAPPARASEIRVYSGGAPQRVLGALLPEFERASGHTVVATFEIVSQVRERVASGDHPDLILLPQQVLADIAEAVRFRDEEFGALARVGIGVIVRDGAERP